MTDHIQVPGDVESNREDDQDPYQVIADFFDYCGVDSHRKYIIEWMETVNKNDFWRYSSPSDLLFYYERLIMLIKAAYQIFKENKVKKTAMDLLNEKGYNEKTNLLHPALYVGWARDHTLWKFFPRNLSLEEYNDPYLVFPKFFSLYNLDEWLYELHELLSDGLSTDNPAEIFTQERNMLLVEKNLLKLVEAVHLIDVREVEYKGEFKKRPPYTLNRPCEDISFTRLLSVELNHKNKSTPGEDVEWEEEDEEYFDDVEWEDEDEEDEIDDDEEDEAYPDDRSNQQGHPFIELTIQGNYQVNDSPGSIEPVKINIPVKNK